MGCTDVFVDVVAGRGLREGGGVGIAAFAVGRVVMVLLLLLRLGQRLGRLALGRRGRVGGGAADAPPDKGAVGADGVAPAAHIARAEAVAFLLPPPAFLAGLGDLGPAKGGCGGGASVRAGRSS